MLVSWLEGWTSPLCCPLSWVNIWRLWKVSIGLRIIGGIISGLFGINHWFVVFCGILARGLVGIGLAHWDIGANKSTRLSRKISWRVNVCIKCFSLWITLHGLGQKKQGNMNAIVEAFAFFLGFLAWLMVGVALPNRYWKVSSVDGNVITTSTIYENLWMSCATDSTGVHNCRDFPSLLALNGMWLTQK